MNAASNLLGDLPTDLSAEHLQTILASPAMRIERIVSHGQTSPPGFWYDQDQHEWVVLISGAARLRMEGEPPIDLTPGAYLNIPAHRRHRVEWTHPTEPTVWLAIHYS